MVWSWGPAFLCGCQTRLVCARISTRPTGCGSFQSSIGLEGLSTRHLGNPSEGKKCLSFASHHFRFTCRMGKQTVQVYLNKHLLKVSPSYTHPSGETSTCLCIHSMYDRCMKLLQCSTKEPVTTGKQSSKELNTMFYHMLKTYRPVPQLLQYFFKETNA